MKRWFVTGIMIALAFQLWAQAPEMFRYQGRLVSGTNLVNATLPMSFKLYDAQSGGNKLYEDSSSVLVVDGLYSTMIGDDTVFGSLTNAMTNAAVYLELTVNGETLSPRERLVSVPYALSAGGDTTPAGTITLSETYPNPGLESQGYSIYREDTTTADWQEINRIYYPWQNPQPPLILFGRSNQLWAFASIPASAGIEPTVFITNDGKQWNSSTLPLPPSGYAPLMDEWSQQVLSHGDKVFLFSKMPPEHNVWSSSDGQSWNVWTNNIDASIDIRRFVSFKGALWSFGWSNSATGPISIVMSSADGTNWTQLSTGSWETAIIDAEGGILTSADKIWMFSRDVSDSMKKVWHSSDGISWIPSATNLPDSVSSPYFLNFDNKLWCLDPTAWTCWSSGDNGDNWNLITTNLPSMDGRTPETRWPVVHDGKLWIVGSMLPAEMTYPLYWSTNGADWILSWAYNQQFPSSSGLPKMIGTANGRLWLITNDGLKIIGGPKQKDGLYYYRKD